MATFPEGVTMRTRLAIAVASLALLGAGPAVTQASHPIAHTACTSATIGGAHKCIARGQFCARSHERDYERYGFRCTKRDRNGRYHLQ
jgi:hypothetical protein